MASQMDQTGKDDLKTQFATREGTYRLMTLSEYSRPNRVGYQTNQSNPQVRVSLVTLPPPGTASTPFVLPRNSSTTSSNASSVSTFTGPARSGGGGGGAGEGLVISPSLINSMTANGGVGIEELQQHQQINILASTSATNHLLPVGSSSPSAAGGIDRICFNFGKELYVYAYRGCKKLSADLSKPIDKKLYKGTNPSCHDFNETMAMADGAPLLVGFTTGQIQLVQPGKREAGRLFNEERLIDKTKVTCLKWLPRSPNLFLVSHASGHLYLYNEELPCTPSAPNYHTQKMGDGYSIQTCKSKQPRNPLFRWTFGPLTTPATGNGNGCINELAFSPCGLMLAIVSQDGFLRVFNYERMDLLGMARSYFGGFLCVCWSPDGKYIVVGGEDDLVTVWSLNERRVVARGQGHRSWVSVVAFDPYTSYSHWDGPDFSDDENPANDGVGTYSRCCVDDNQPQLREHGGGRYRTARPMSSSSTIPDKIGTSYRLGSVSQDTQLCLWDITEDVLRQSHDIRLRLSSHDPSPVVANGGETTTTAYSPTINLTNESSTDPINVPANNTAVRSIDISHNSSNSEPPATNKMPKTKSASISSKTDKSQDLSNKSNTTKTTMNDSNSSSGSGLTALNSLTLRLSHFSFGSGDSKKSSSDKKSSIFSKSANTSANTHVPPSNHNSFNETNYQSVHPAPPASSSSFSAPPVTAPAPVFSKDASLESSRHFSTSRMPSNLAIQSPTGSIVPSSYDPMQLIGTSVCPRFDECPLLEPLICKKIAHERLTALIFREDCFLTACQDGLIYTWARPGFSCVD